MSVSLIDGHIDDDVQKLKTCPFCGGEAMIAYDECFDDFMALCKHCNVSTRLFDNKEIATEAWNRRVDNG